MTLSNNALFGRGEEGRGGRGTDEGGEGRMRREEGWIRWGEEKGVEKEEGAREDR